MATEQVAPKLGFSVVSKGDRTTFDVTPPPLTTAESISVHYIKGSMVFMLSAVGALIGILPGLIMQSWLIFWIFVAIGGIAGWLMTGRGKHSLANIMKPVTVEVDPKGITINGKQYQREHITSFWMQLGNERQQAHHVAREIYMEPSATREVTAAAFSTLQKRSYSVQMQYASEDVLIAQFLPEGTARVLLGMLVERFNAGALTQAA